MNDLLKRLTSFPTQFFLIVIGTALFLPLLGDVPLFDWDELMPAESSREMLLSGNYGTVQINFQPFSEKPPLFFWIQALSMKIFGVNEYAARFPNVLVGIVVLLVLFNIGRNVFDSVLGVFWALLMAIAVLPQFYFRSGFVHPVYDLFAFISVFYLFKLSTPDDFSPAKHQRKSRWRYVFYSALFAGLATLVKGPAAVVIIVLTATVQFVSLRGKMKMELGQLFLWWFLLLLIVFSWLGIELYTNGTQFVEGFTGFYKKLLNTNAEGHGGPVFYHVLVLLIGFFPASALVFDSFRRDTADSEAQRNFKRWMIYLFVINLVVFSLAKTKIVHYSSLCGYPLTFLAAYYLYKLWNGKYKWTWRQTLPAALLGVLFGAAVIAAPLLAERRLELLPYLKDDFAAACLQAAIYVQPNEIWLGVIFLVLVITSIALVYMRYIRVAVSLLLIASAVFFNTLLLQYVPRAERFSQHALIDFVRKTAIEQPNYEVRGFKSYAHYFYGQTEPNHRSNTTYVITKVNLVLRIDTSDLTFLYAKNGYVFYRKN